MRRTLWWKEEPVDAEKILEFQKATWTMKHSAEPQLSFMEAYPRKLLTIFWPKAGLWQQEAVAWLLVVGICGAGKYGIPTSESWVVGRPHACAPGLEGWQLDAVLQRRQRPVQKHHQPTRKNLIRTRWTKRCSAFPSPSSHSKTLEVPRAETWSKNYLGLWIRGELENWAELQ